MTVQQVAPSVGLPVYPADPGTPDWWVSVLYDRLMGKQGLYTLYDNYYCGNHPIPWLAAEAQEEFKRLLPLTMTNYMGLVCDSIVERVNIEGFRFGAESQSDRETWELWQRNNMDAEAPSAFLESSICGSSYYLVEPNVKSPMESYIGVEDTTQAIVVYEPGSNRRERKAGLKLWMDEWTGLLNATLFLMWPERSGELMLRVFKFQADKPQRVRAEQSGETVYTYSRPQWMRRAVAKETWGDLGRLSGIPLVEIPNNPRIKTGGRSELADLINIQDRINKTVADRLMTQDYGAFPQKWIKGWPEFQDDGVTRNPPIEIGRARAVTTDAEGAAFGQWESAPLDPYSFAKREDVKDIAARARVPAQYLLGDMSNVNGETLKASESGHIATVKLRMKPWAEATEEANRMLREAAGISTPTDYTMETIFSNPEFRTEGELTDAVVKRVQTRIISIRQARVDLGYTDTQIRDLERDDMNEALHPVVQKALREIGGGNGDNVTGGPDNALSPPSIA